MSHLAPYVGLAAVLGFLALRLVAKALKLGLLLAAPALLYALHH